MVSRVRLFPAVFFGLIVFVSAAGAQALPEPGDGIDRIGQKILTYVDGRSLAEAGNSAENPFAVNTAEVLKVLNLGAIDAAVGQQSVAEGGLSLLLSPVKPVADLAAEKGFSDILPYAFLRNGFCRAGYVSGYPVINEVFSIDIGTRPCNADAVVEAVASRYNDKVKAGTMPITVISPMKCVDQANCPKGTPRPVSPPPTN